MGNDLWLCKWNQFKSKIHTEWSDFPEQELDRYRSNLNLLSQSIVRRYRESQMEVQNFVDNLWFEVFVRGSKHRLPVVSGLRVEAGNYPCPVCAAAGYKHIHPGG